MSLPAALGRLSLPAVAAPMFLVSGTKIVTETCKSGIVGTLPALNARSSDVYASWLDDIKKDLTSYNALNPAFPAAPYGINLIVHKTNPRLQADLDITVEHKVPIVITSLGAVSSLVDAVHSYGGLVFHDVTSIRHAEKAAAAGVDGLIAVCAGAGGHAGNLSPLAFLSEIRSFFNKTILLSGCVSTGRDIATARMLGADLAYIGTRFIASKESLANEDYKQMITKCQAKDILYTPEISGIHANFLRPSLLAAGLDPDNLEKKKNIDLGEELSSSKAWRDIWSAGQGVGSISDASTSVADLVEQLKQEYRDTIGQFIKEERNAQRI